MILIPAVQTQTRVMKQIISLVQGHKWKKNVKANNKSGLQSNPRAGVAVISTFTITCDCQSHLFIQILTGNSHNSIQTILGVKCTRSKW